VPTIFIRVKTGAIRGADNSHWAQDHRTSFVLRRLYLTGMAVREDHGLSVGVVMENPNVPDRDPNYERHLWNVARGLDRTFLAGRSDFNVAEIKRRFDITSTATITERWGISTTLPALFVHTYSFPDQTYIATLPMTYTKQILNLHAPNGVNQAGQVISPTLLFAREEHYRSANLELSTDIVNTGSSITERGVISGTVLRADLIREDRNGAGQCELGAILSQRRLESCPSMNTGLIPRYREIFRSETRDPDGYAGRPRGLCAGFYFRCAMGRRGQIGQHSLTAPSAAADAVSQHRLCRRLTPARKSSRSSLRRSQPLSGQVHAITRERSGYSRAAARGAEGGGRISRSHLGQGRYRAGGGWRGGRRRLIDRGQHQH
jgi:hypothetical protein